VAINFVGQIQTQSTQLGWWVMEKQKKSAQWIVWYKIPKAKKGKVFPYSLPSVGPGADPGVQAVSPQVT